MCTWEGSVFSCCWVENSVCVYQVQFAYSVVQVFCFVIFFLIFLSFKESGVLKSPTSTVELSTSPFSSVNFCMIYFGVLLLGAYMFIIVMSYIIFCSSILPYRLLYQKGIFQYTVLLPSFLSLSLLYISIFLMVSLEITINTLVQINTNLVLIKYTLFLYSSIPILLCYYYKLHLYTICVYQLRFVTVALCSCLLNHIGGKRELQIENTLILTFVFNYIVTFLVLFLCVDLSYCLVSFHFSLKDSLQHFSQGRSTSDKTLSVFVYLGMS